MIRYSSRAVHESVSDYIESKLVGLGWADPANTPFGAPALRISTATPRPHQQDTTTIAPGAVTITLGDTTDAVPQELGGPLYMIEYPIFVDIFMDKDAHALAVAQDVIDICSGRLPTTARYLPVLDLITGVAADGWLIELEDIERTRPTHELKVHWQVVKVTATTYFNEVSY